MVDDFCFLLLLWTKVSKTNPNSDSPGLPQTNLEQPNLLVIFLQGIGV